jgi:hypothetical protein
MQTASWVFYYEDDGVGARVLDFRKKIMKKLQQIIISLLVFLILFMPVASFAQTTEKGLVPCNNNGVDVVNSDGTTTKAVECNFDMLLNLVNTVIKFVLFNMVVPIAAIMFCYAGFLMITAGEETASARTKAKSIFTNAFFGLIIAVAAWLIVRTLLSILGYDGDWIGFPK